MYGTAHRSCKAGLLLTAGATLLISRACAMPIGQVKQLPDGAIAPVGPAIVTQSFFDVFYVQDSHSPAGILARALPNPYVEGMQVNLSGVLHTDADGERFLQVTNGNILGPAPLVRPLVTANRYIGGGDFHFVTPTGAGQRGITGGIGLNNVGMLVSVAGFLQPLDPQRFLINDGSNANLTVETTFLPLPVNPNSYYQVTGVSSLQRLGATYSPVVWVAGANGIKERYGARGKCAAWIGDSNEIDGPGTVKRGEKAAYSVHQPLTYGCGQCAYSDDGVQRFADCDATVSYRWFRHGYIPGTNGSFDFVGATDTDTAEIRGTQTGAIDIECEITVVCKSLPGCQDTISKTFRKSITITDP